MKLPLALLLVAVVPMLTPAQTVDAPAPSAAVSGDQAPLFRAHSELVVVHATVLDRHGKHVSGLTPQAFRIFENGAPRPVSVFSGQYEPVTLGLILDVSGSMTRTRERLAYAASAFAGTGSPDDELFAIVVGDRPAPVLPPDAPFTSDAHVLRTAIARAHRPGGMTALYSAIAEGLDQLARGSNPRRALVVISDGIDNASQLTFDDTLRRAQTSNAALYAVVLADPAAVSRDPGHLRRLTRASGGEAYFPDDNTAALDSLEHIAADIHQSYTLGFVPSALAKDGGRSRLDVRVQTADGQRLTVRAREEYVRPASEPTARAW